MCYDFTYAYIWLGFIFLLTIVLIALCICTFRETCKEVQQEGLKASMEESQWVENSEEIWRKSSSSKRKSEHVFDFDLEEAKIEPVHKMVPYTSIRNENGKRQRKENSDFPTQFSLIWEKVKSKYT